MKCKLVFLVLLLSACSQQSPAPFSERVAEAESLESMPAGGLYMTSLLNEHGPVINSFIGECYATSALKKDNFTLVADIDQHGKFTNIAVQPESDTTRCFAQDIANLRVAASRPADFTSRTIPIVFKVNYEK